MALPEPTKPHLIAELVYLLRGVGFEPTSRDLADLLWLAGYLDAPAEPLEAQTRRIPEESPKPSQPSSKPDNAPNPPPENKSGDSSEKRAGIYAGEHSGLRFTTPGGVALPGKLAIGRALRPLMRRVPSLDRFELDEDATVQRIADESNWLPVLRPALERWLELDLVVDEWSSMIIWQPAVNELHRFLEQLGAFRSVRTWGVQTDGLGNSLRLHAGLQTSARSWHSPKELIEPRGNRLILVLSDCLSPAWYEGQMGQLLATWGKSQMVALVQMLPERLWPRSGLGNATPLWLRAHAPGMSNHRLQQRLPWDLSGDAKPQGFPIPVMTLEPEMIAVWANLMVGKEHIWTSGFLLPLDDNVENQHQAEAGIPPELTPEERLNIFRSLASPLAYKLATYLAATSLSLPVMRLVQRVMLPESRQVHLAEFFLSGLIRGKGGMRYDFLPSIRELLLRDVPISDKFEVLRSVSHFVDRHTGQPIDFSAIVSNPEILKDVRRDADTEMFAAISTQVLRQLGGEFTQLAEQIESELGGMPDLQEAEQGITVSASESSVTPLPLTATPVRVDRQAHKERIRAFFSHSYRSEDKHRNLFFWELFSEQGCYFSVDQKTSSETPMDVTYLEWLMRYSDCFIAVIPKRVEPNSPDGCSPYQSFENGLAFRANKPRLIFVENGLPERLFVGSDDEICFFHPTRYKEQESIFREKIYKFLKKVRAHPSGISRHKKPIAIITEKRNGYTDDVFRSIKQVVKQSGYELEKIISPSEMLEDDFSFVTEIEKYEILISETRQSYVTFDLLASMHQRFIPMIRICHLEQDETEEQVSRKMNLSRDEKEWIEDTTRETSTLLRGYKLDSEMRPVIFWKNPAELIDEIANRLQRMEMGKSRYELLTTSDAKRYFLSIGRRSEKVFISNAHTANDLGMDLAKRLFEEGINRFHYMDFDAIPIGDSNWAKAVEQAIDESSIFVVLINKDYLQSKWCLSELEHALARRRNDKITIHPYLVDDMDWPEKLNFIQGKSLTLFPKEKWAELITIPIIDFLESETAPGTDDIAFPGNSRARTIHINKDTPAEEILAEFAFDPFPRAVIQISGGAKEFPRYLPNNGFAKMRDLIKSIVDMAFEKNIMLVDGGTNTGVMQLIGNFFKERRISNPKDNIPPLVGFVPELLVNYPGASIKGRDPEADSLDPNHPYFVLVKDAKVWGDEADSMFAFVNTLSMRIPSVSLIVNGGLATLKDAVHNVRYGREIIVIDGSQRATRAIIAAINGSTESELTKILLDRSNEGASLIDIKNHYYEQKLESALSDLTEIAQYKKITRFSLDASPVELTNLIVSKLGLT